MESGSHLREHPDTVKLTLLAALLHSRQREITDALVELLIWPVHRIGARADKRVVQELVNAFKRVTGKENILFAIAEACVGAPDEPVRAVVFPAVTGGEQTLRELVHEYKTKGPVYRPTVQTTLKASYSNHYRRGLIDLLGVLEFRSNNATHRPVLDALALITRHADARLTYYPATEAVPTHKALLGDWTPLVFQDTSRGRRRVIRTVYEICTFQALRERLRCKERDLGGRRRQVAQPRRRPARRLRRPPGRALRGAAQTDRCERVHRPAPTRNAHRTGRPAGGAAEAGVAGHPRPRQAGGDQTHRLRRRARTA